MSSANPTNHDTTTAFTAPAVTAASPSESDSPKQFFPEAPQTGVTEAEVEALLLKSLFTRGAATGRELSEQIKLNGPLVRESLDRLRAELLVTYKSTTKLGDFIFQLTESGAQRSKFLSLKNTYCGATPVSLEGYSASVEAQSIRKQPIRLDRFQEALSDLSIEKHVLSEPHGLNLETSLLIF